MRKVGEIEMIDKNEIIQGLHEIVDQKTSDGIVDGVNQQLISRTLALLKEQEAVEPVITPCAVNADGEVEIAKRECGHCGYQFFTEKPNYCENCGTPILWEGR